MICDVDSDNASLGRRATPSLAIVGRNATVVARTTGFDAAEFGTLADGMGEEMGSVVRSLIERLDDGGMCASAKLAGVGHVRVFPLLGLIATYAVTIERERSAPSFDASTKRFALTARESDVLRLLVDGATNAEIARALSIRETTVISHVHNIGSKVGATKRSTIIGRVLGSMGG